MKIFTMCVLTVSILVIGCNRKSLAESAPAQVAQVPAPLESGWSVTGTNQNDCTIVAYPGGTISFEKSDVYQYVGRISYVAMSSDKVILRVEFIVNNIPNAHPPVSYELELGLDKSVIISSFYGFQDTRFNYAVRVSLVKLDEDGVATFSLSRVLQRNAAPPP